MDTSPEEPKHTSHVCERKGCGKRGYFPRCSQCKMVRYCGRECQTADWRSHKPRCEPNKLPAMDKRTEKVLRSGAAKKIAEKAGPLIDQAMYAHGVGSGAYLATQVDLGQGIKLGTSPNGFWLKFRGEEDRVELGKLVGMVPLGDAIERVMKDRQIRIKGLDAAMKLMEATARVFSASVK